MNLFHRTAYDTSKLITKAYSTSFMLGIRTLSKKFHDPVFGIYGMVRYADEIVDSFHDFDKKKLLQRFKEDTFSAIDDGISLNPVLHAFQRTVHQYGIDNDLIIAFFNSMEMDLEQKNHDPLTYKEYIYGSAEVVGLMCLKVFTENDIALYQRLEKPARSLGAAFQKVNFLRDIQSDFAERGRVYFPGVDLNEFTLEKKTLIEKDILKDFEDAFIGIQNLPSSSSKGVMLAYQFYLKLFEKIVKTPADRLQETRIRVPDYQKAGLMINAMLGI
jgi:phytoene/squalene synthetase